MATITPTSMTGSGDRQVTTTILSASDTFSYAPGSVLILNNITAGALTPNIVGDEAGTVTVQGVGSIDVSTGYDLASIAADESVAIPLDTISKYLTGTIAVTGADGVEAQLLTF